MILRAATVFALMAALVLFILSLSIGSWPCGGLFESCEWPNHTTSVEVSEYHVVGGLLVVAALTVFFGLAFTMCSLCETHQMDKRTWIRVMAIIFNFIAFAVAITADIYFHTRMYHDWSAFFGAVALTLSFVNFVIQVAQMYQVKFSPVIRTN